MDKTKFQKEITVTNLNSRRIEPKPGQNFKAFSVYSISGNDGIDYETTDQKWYSERKVGESISLEYFVDSKVGSNGKVYSHYKILLNQEKNSSSPLVIEGLTKIYARIEQMENNILAKIDLGQKKSLAVPEIPVIKYDLPEDPNAELDRLYNSDGEQHDAAVGEP